MKNIKYIVLAVVAIVCGFALTSCTDDNDWSVDKSHDRLFTPTSLVVEDATKADSVVISFSACEDVAYYIVEICTDGKLFTEDVPVGQMKGSHVFGEDKSIKGTSKSYVIPYKFENYMYQIRIKACSNNPEKGDSRWLNYCKDDEYFFEVGTEVEE